jgi:hypothetical protein
MEGPENTDQSVRNRTDREPHVRNASTDVCAPGLRRSLVGRQQLADRQSSALHVAMMQAVGIAGMRGVLSAINNQGQGEWLPCKSV